ncbi:hypothetical protein V8E54_013905 [Elaphomyces granulatus]
MLAVDESEEILRLPPQEQDFDRRLHSSTCALRPQPPRSPLQMSPPMSSTTVTMTATATAATSQDGCCDGCCDCSYDSRKRGRPKGSRDKELRKRRQKATGGGDTTATGN